MSHHDGGKVPIEQGNKPTGSREYSRTPAALSSFVPAEHSPNLHVKTLDFFSGNYIPIVNLDCQGRLMENREHRG